MVANNKCYLQKQRTLAHFAGIRSGRFHTSECRQLRTGQCEVKSCIFTSEWTVSLIRRERATPTHSDARKPTDIIWAANYHYVPHKHLQNDNLLNSKCNQAIHRKVGRGMHFATVQPLRCYDSRVSS